MLAFLYRLMGSAVLDAATYEEIEGNKKATGQAFLVVLPMVVAVRQALDYSTIARALAVCAVGWFLALATALALGVVYGPTLS